MVCDFSNVGLNAGTVKHLISVTMLKSTHYHCTKIISATGIEYFGAVIKESF
jgi:hypothetical protein